MATTTSDAALVRAAQSGDQISLAVLLRRHMAGMKAVAVSILGYGPDADDAVQDAALLTLTRIGQLRDAAAAGAFLRAIVRNCCLMQIRAPRPVPVPEDALVRVAASGITPEQALDRRAMKEWVWHAINDLSEPLRLVVLLRYFTEASTYEQIAAVCGLPIGTVRSRLSQGKLKLVDALLSAANSAHDDTGRRAVSWRLEADEAFRAAEQGSFARALAGRWSPDLRFEGPGGQSGRGLEILLRVMDSDLRAGVRHRLRDVVAASDLVIWEDALVSPPDDPQHCPPSVLWLQQLRNDRVVSLRLFHPQPSRER